MTFDLLISGGTIVDGTGAPAYPGDVGVMGDRISAMGRLEGASGKETIHAAGLIVAPGFIDVHNHAHSEAEGGILNIPRADNLVRMGVTTLIAGNCGGSPWPLDEHLDAVACADIRQNYGILLGHGTIRRKSVEKPNAPASPAEVATMQDLVREGMDAGAFGMSTGYFAQCVTLEEIVEVSKAVAERGGIYTSHIRNEEKGLIEAIEEGIAVAEGAGIPVQISHIKTYGRTAWPWVAQVLDLIHGAQDRGASVHADRYPYVACFTGITSLIGREVPAEAGARGGIAHVRDEDLIEETRKAVQDYLYELDGPSNVLLAPLDPRPDMEGRRLSEVALDRGQDPVDTAIDLAVEGNASCIFFAMDEENLKTFYRDPSVWVASDGHLRVFGKGVSHPRNYGTFPRALGKYGREEACFSLEEGVAKMTGLPADKFGIKGRGVLAVGNCADLTLFDGGTIRDQATFEDAHQYPVGIPYVIVNGGIAVRAGETRGGCFGRVLRKMA